MGILERDWVFWKENRYLGKKHLTNVEVGIVLKNGYLGKKTRQDG